VSLDACRGFGIPGIDDPVNMFQSLVASPLRYTQGVITIAVIALAVALSQQHLPPMLPRLTSR
jgi:hypothetical protein